MLKGHYDLNNLTLKHWMIAEVGEDERKVTQWRVLAFRVVKLGRGI